MTNLAAALGLVQGAGGEFRPDESITREEMAVILIRALRLEDKAREKARELAGGDQSRFADGNSIASWARGSVELAAELGLIAGMGEGKFSPKTAVTRAQGATMLLRLMDQLGMIGR